MEWQEWDEDKWEAIGRYDYDTRWMGESWAKAFMILGKYGDKGRVNIEAAHEEVWVGPMGRDPLPNPWYNSLVLVETS